jgi:hypothetical protein
MIPVIPQPEPVDFDIKVRQKGISFLAGHPNATAESIQRGHNYWTAVADDLYRIYNGYCAYSAYYVPSLQVDHYVPVKKLVEDGERYRAYEWENFRPASDRINNFKLHFTDVIDPFIIKHGWFAINFKTVNLEIRKGKDVPEEFKGMVNSTIRRLKFNDKFSFVNYRCRMLGSYCENCNKYPGTMGSNFDCLKSIAPFIAYELERQELKEQIIQFWEYNPEKIRREIAT